MRAAATPILAALILSAGGAAAEDLVVVLESTVPSLAPGTVVSPQASVTLRRGDRVVVIDVDGATVVVEGPCAGALRECVAAATPEAPGRDKFRNRGVPVAPEHLPRTQGQG